MRCCISSEFLGDAHAACLWTTLRVVRVFLIPGSATEPGIISSCHLSLCKTETKISSFLDRDRGEINFSCSKQ